MGWVCILNGGVIAWGSALCKFRCTGVMDVEEAAAAWASKDAVYRRELMNELGLQQTTPTVLLCDNMATISFSKPSAVLSLLSKHILVRGAYTRELQQRDVIELVFCPGRLNVADSMTKVLDKSQHYGLTLPKLGFINITLPPGYQPPRPIARRQPTSDDADG